MNVSESLRRFGTVTFGLEVMRQLIGFGEATLDPVTGQGWINHDRRPGTLCLDLWFFQVPQCYRADIAALLERHRDDLRNWYIGRFRADEASRRVIIDTIHRWIETEIEPR